MRREDKKKLIINRRVIVNHLLDLEGVLDYLITKQIITPAVRERIVHDSRTPADKIRHLLDYLITRNALAYQYFLEALILTNNTHIANVLDPEYSSSEQCRLLMERERAAFLAHHPPHHRLNLAHSNLMPHEGQNLNLPYPVTCSQNHESYAMNGPTSSASSGHFEHLCRSSHSMSPSIYRSRSSSVQALLSMATSRAASLSSGCSNSGNFFSSNAMTTSTISSSSCSSSTNRNSYADADRSCSPDVLARLGTVATNITSTDSTWALSSNVDWSHVNRLELDFVVNKTLPNLRKQLNVDECYQMERVPRGYCLIINNEHFYNSDEIEIPELRRYGTDLDASRLRNLFEKLHFRVEMRVDLKEMQMRDLIRSFADECELNTDSFDAIALIVLTHGTDGYIYGVDYENKLNIDKDVLNLFDDVLIGKPKLFIFQACRGEYLNQKGISCMASSPSRIFAVQSDTKISINTCTAPTEITGKPPQPMPTSLDDETIKRFKQLKMCSTSPSSLQLTYKKKNCASKKQEKEEIKKEMSTKDISKSSKSSTMTSASSTTSTWNSKVAKTRSRSHSRGKYSHYLSSAASALKTAIKLSPNATKTVLNSISTQTSVTYENEEHKQSNEVTTSGENKPVPESCSISAGLANNLIGNGSCFVSSNIITSSFFNRHQSFANFIDGRPIRTALPSRSDFFIWYSSVRGFVSHRDLDGSPFIKCLVTVFSKCAFELELIEMVRKVNMLMQQYEKRHFDERNSVASYFMVPVAEFHLAKRLYFNP